MKSNNTDDFNGIDTEFLGREAAAEMNHYGAICNISEEDALDIAIRCMWLYCAAEALMKNKRKIPIGDLPDISSKRSEEILKELHAVMRGETSDIHLPEGESSLAIETEACDLRGVSEKEWLANPVAQIVPEQIGKIDPHGIPQHEPGAKLDAGKPMADLLLDFSRALLSVAEVGTYGAHKYTRGGWQHVPDGVHRYTGALLRHLLQEKVEDLDQDTELLHASHAAWNALARLELLLRERESNGSLHTTDKTAGE